VSERVTFIAKMELRLLGSLDVLGERGHVDVPAGKPRSLLILLALHPNEPVTSDRMVDALWGEAPPASATAVVHTYISRLRKTLGEGRIETSGHAYRLVLEQGERDIDRVESLRARATSEPPLRAAQTLREAVALFRGPPLADVADEEFARAEIRKLDELRAALEVERMEAELAAGRHADVLADLEGLVASRPLDERLRGLLMLALYRSGRQADALAVYQDARRLLVDELGLEPSDELKELQRRILEQDPSIRAPAPKRPVVATVPRALGGPRRRVVGALALAVVVAASALGIAAVSDRGAVRRLPVVPNSVAAIDPESLRVVASIPVGQRPLYVAATPEFVWVAAVADRTLAQIDPESFRVVRTVGLGFEPTDLEAVGSSVWVAGGFDHVLWRVDRDGLPRIKLTFREKYGPLPAGYERGRAGLASSDEGLWLAHGNEVTLLDPTSGEPVADAEAGGPWADDIDVGSAVIVEDIDGGRVEGLDPQTLEPTSAIFVGAGRDVNDILVVSGYVWVLKWFTDSIWQLEEGSLTLHRTIDVLDYPVALAFADDAIWVATQRPTFLRRINSRTGDIEGTLALEHTPEGMAAANDLLWVAVRDP
jgi:DNA-binding SARP family transcriptional activator